MTHNWPCYPIGADKASTGWSPNRVYGGDALRTMTLALLLCLVLLLHVIVFLLREHVRYSFSL